MVVLHKKSRTLSECAGIKSDSYLKLRHSLSNAFLIFRGAIVCYSDSRCDLGVEILAAMVRSQSTTNEFNVTSRRRTGPHRLDPWSLMTSGKGPERSKTSSLGGGHDNAWCSVAWSYSISISGTTREDVELRQDVETGDLEPR
jgi:hypothetical protein